MAALDHDRHRQVVHQLAGVAGVGLQQQRLLMAAAAGAGAVVEQAFAAAMDHIMFTVAGGLCAERLVMGRHIAIRGAGDGEYQALMATQQRLLQGRQGLVGVVVEATAVLLRPGVGDGLVIAVEQVFQANATALDIGLELRGNRLGAFAGQVQHALVVVIQGHRRQALADLFGLPLQAFGSRAEAAGMGIALGQVAAHLLHRTEQAAELVAVVVCTLGNLADLRRHALGQLGDLLQAAAGLFDRANTDVQVAGQLLDLLDHGRRLLLDIGDHLADFLGGAGGASGQATHLVGDHGKATAVFAGPRRLDGGIQGQQVGLTGNRLDHLGDPLDVLAALAQGFNQHLAGTGALAELVHAGDGLLHHGQALIAALADL